MQLKLNLFPYLLILTYVLGAQKNRLIETVLLSTHYICFGLEIRKKKSVCTLIRRPVMLQNKIEVVPLY